MTVFKHEMRQNRNSLIIWTAVIAFLLVICVIMYPLMKTEAEALGDMFSNMGDFTAAFGMDRLDIGTLIGFYGIESGNIIGIGGALFAALMGISALAKEERDHTAEFLLSHPISRARLVSEKLLALIAQIVILNLVIFAAALISIRAIGEDIELRPLFLMHIAFFLLQIQIGTICFGISAYLRKGGVGLGLGLAMILYFLNIISNISEKAEFLKYITPFSYADPSNIIANLKLDGTLLAIGFIYAALGVFEAYLKYTKKDISI